MRGAPLAEFNSPELKRRGRIAQRLGAGESVRAVAAAERCSPWVVENVFDRDRAFFLEQRRRIAEERRTRIVQRVLAGEPARAIRKAERCSLALVNEIRKQVRDGR